MNEQQRVRVVRQHFAALGQGDIVAARDVLAEDADFQSPVPRPPPVEISWAKPRHSHRLVADLSLDNAILEEARVLIEQWRREYNQIRPHSAKNYRPPAPEAILPTMLTT